MRLMAPTARDRVIPLCKGLDHHAAVGAILRGEAAGDVYVDGLRRPRSALLQVKHRFFLAGAADNTAFTTAVGAWFGERVYPEAKAVGAVEWLLYYDGEPWEAAITATLGDRNPIRDVRAYYQFVALPHPRAPYPRPWMCVRWMRLCWPRVTWATWTPCARRCARSAPRWTSSSPRAWAPASSGAIRRGARWSPGASPSTTTTRASAALGRLDEALGHLNDAVDRGFAHAGAIGDAEELRVLHGTEGWRRLMARVGRGDG